MPRAGHGVKAASRSLGSAALTMCAARPDGLGRCRWTRFLPRASSTAKGESIEPRRYMERLLSAECSYHPAEHTPDEPRYVSRAIQWRGLCQHARVDRDHVGRAIGLALRHGRHKPVPGRCRRAAGTRKGSPYSASGKLSVVGPAQMRGGRMAAHEDVTLAADVLVPLGGSS
jgi:hypothetical protein